MDKFVNLSHGGLEIRVRLEDSVSFRIILFFS